MNRKTYIIPLLLCLVFMACNPTRRLKENESLLVKNEIKFSDKKYDKEHLLGIIKQKPNRKILGLFRFHLWLYNTVDKEKTAIKREKKVQKWVAWNQAHPNKTPIDTNKLTFREKILNIGEEPVVLDTSLAINSARQLSLFLYNKGYFNVTIKDSIKQVGKQKEKVTYYINLMQQYKIRNIADSSLDTVVLNYVNASKSQTLLHNGDSYDAGNLDKERTRITTELRNNGYYFFNKNYITYTVDSNLNSHQVDIGLYINRVNENVSEQLLNDREIRNHYQYYLNNIYIQTDYNPQKLDESVATDTSYYKDYILLLAGTYERFKKDAILDVMFFKKGDRFKLSDVDYTYTRISDLNVFRYNNIKFQEVRPDSSNGKHLLDAFVQLTPVAMQDVSIEPEATRNGGYAGIAGNLAYHDKNLFRGMELLEVKFKAAIESQQNIAGTISPSQILFNTIDFGPEVNLSIKRFLFPANVAANLFGFRREINPKTTFTVSYDFQDRPDFDRSILTGSYWYTWKQSKTVREYLYLFEINSIHATNVSPDFKQNLINLGNQTLYNSFKTHIITSSRFSLEFSDEELKHGIDFNYFRGNIEWGWNLWNVIPNSSNFYRIDADYRHYFKLNTNNTFVSRVYGGYGLPYSGATSLPFEKSFYAGGSNDIRAWRFSTLGPGSLSNPFGVEEAGNVKMEGNIELRSELFKFFEGAAFIDAGNIWTTDTASAGKQAVFNSNFLTQIAIGGGLGIRLNFGFFIFRVDGAVKLYDPSLDEADKWVYSHQKFSVSDINFNFGIGYPF